MAHSIKRIRTMALVGQSGAGKTTLAEALLSTAGAIPAAGSVERGTTVGDYTALEKQLQHSLKLAVCSFDCQDTKIHLLDTPGYPDFLGHALPADAADLPIGQPSVLSTPSAALLVARRSRASILPVR